MYLLFWNVILWYCLFVCFCVWKNKEDKDWKSTSFSCQLMYLYFYFILHGWTEGKELALSKDFVSVLCLVALIAQFGRLCLQGLLHLCLHTSCDQPGAWARAFQPFSKPVLEEFNQTLCSWDQLLPGADPAQFLPSTNILT